jgi:hypothetical protein
MQLNIYVPDDKAQVLADLNEEARRTRRPKNEIVLEALETYLQSAPLELGVYHLGKVNWPDRDELYLDREE